MSSSSEEPIHAVAILTPTKGKEAQLKEALIKLAEDIHAKEMRVPKYQVFEQYDAADGVNTFVVQEVYATQAAFEEHFTTPYFLACASQLSVDGVLAKDLDIKRMKPIGGFEAR